MSRSLVSLFMIILGLIIVFYVPAKNSIKMNTEYNSVPNKSHYPNKLLDLITGFGFTIIGIISFFNLLNTEMIVYFTLSILFLPDILKVIIYKRYKEINYYEILFNCLMVVAMVSIVIFIAIFCILNIYVNL